MRSYLEYVETIEKAMRDAEKLPAPALKPAAFPKAATGAKTVAVISPHPDDEMLIGLLALRFMRECGAKVVDIAATLGSNRERQSARWAELKNACASIGFTPRTFGERGLEHITPDARGGASWENAVKAMASAIAEIKPDAVFFPHEKDANRTHMGVHFLAMDALAKARHACVVFETEFWAPMETPNLMIEGSKEDVASLVEALTHHVGEVARNPYHLRLPAWMMDNVRRGGELVGSQGGAAPRFTFATLYRREYWDGRAMTQLQDKGLFISREDNPAGLLTLPN
jgi:LmbE family N-acetylglucosaminyl deacetylase